MEQKERALRIIFWVSLLGVLFSGYMSYMEIFNGMCAIGTCRVNIQIATIPACVYGLAMYIIIMILACYGLKCTSWCEKNQDSKTSKKKKQ